MFKNLLPVILIGIVVAGFFMLINPMYKDITTIRAQIASYDEALGNSKVLENQRDELTKKYNSIDPENLKKLAKFLPDSIDNIRLILEIEKLANPYGMFLRDVKYATTEAANTKDVVAAGTALSTAKQKNYGTWDLEFSTQGTYSNFINFLRDLENNLRVVDVVFIDFISETVTGVNSGLSEVYKYNIKIKTYWLKN